ncbi:hypothetical protein [Psychroflexus maritimus]|uniref:Uncharacterized protein n=1 Tax=Psychroflexus maritimus TaxID=2714865 RepID=A0A967AFU2_9FLAO|nr:hypothetical protein [Psychroflexus maritimus]NGZ89731.1 hypothetical protein [Psychroflexus maritimus]
MKLPRFLLGDNTDFPESIFVIHTEYPRFIIDLSTDDLQFWEAIHQSEEDDLKEETENLIKEASAFYDQEVERYTQED